MSLLLLTVTLRGVSNKHCLLPVLVWSAGISNSGLYIFLKWNNVIRDKVDLNKMFSLRMHLL